MPCKEEKLLSETLSFIKIFHLYKDSEEDDHNGSCDEESFLWEVVNQEDEGETDCPPQASVGNDELISKGHSVPPELVHHSSEQENTFRGGEMRGFLYFDNCLSSSWSQHHWYIGSHVQRQHFLKCRKDFCKATCGPPDEAEQQCGADKGPAPHMDVLYCRHAQEDED